MPVAACELCNAGQRSEPNGLEDEEGRDGVCRCGNEEKGNEVKEEDTVGAAVPEEVEGKEATFHKGYKEFCRSLGVEELPEEQNRAWIVILLGLIFTFLKKRLVFLEKPFAFLNKYVLKEPFDFVKSCFVFIFDFFRKFQATPQLGVVAVNFKESPLRRSRHRPTSVHRLRLGDLDILVVMGDSMTTGYRAVDFFEKTNSYFLHHIWANRAGGELEESFTFGALLKFLNPEIKGIASGIVDPYIVDKGKKEGPGFDWGYNASWGGQNSGHLLSQAEVVVDRMKANNEDLGNAWVAVVLFIGMNDYGYLAWHRKDKDLTLPVCFKENIVMAVAYLKENVKRAVVFLVAQPGSEFMVEATHTAKKGERKGPKEICDERDRFVDAINEHLYEIELEFSGDDEFAVVVSNFWEKNNDPARNEDGSVHLNFYAQDVFHPSKWGNSAMAVNFVANLFEKPGEKNKKADFGKKDKVSIKLPDEEFPFIRTLGNSQ